MVATVAQDEASTSTVRNSNHRQQVGPLGSRSAEKIVSGGEAAQLRGL